ncbi:hypothetical protein OG474_03750 [Kribbella sp. NBC_01505]|uniref:hypothetical protein n=1 Tax=Kribbella sp. NBC_01505 TaxID=2903580 RepID=UPI00386FAD94
MRISRRTFSLVTVMTLAGSRVGNAPTAIAAVTDGLEVSHYAVNIRYQLTPEVLSGVTTILATASRKLPAFNLQFLLAVSSVTVNNEPAEYTSKDGTLTVAPKTAVPAGADLVIRRQKTDEAPTTAQFSTLAEEIAGQDLDSLFRAWIYAPERPVGGPNGAHVVRRSARPKSYEQITANRELLSSSTRPRRRARR